MERKYRYNFPAENKCDQLTKVDKKQKRRASVKGIKTMVALTPAGMSCSLLDIVGGVCSAEEGTSVFYNFQVLRQRWNLS